MKTERGDFTCSSKLQEVIGHFRWAPEALPVGCEPRSQPAAMQAFNSQL